MKKITILAPNIPHSKVYADLYRNSRIYSKRCLAISGQVTDLHKQTGTVTKPYSWQILKSSNDLIDSLLNIGTLLAAI